MPMFYLMKEYVWINVNVLWEKNNKAKCTSKRTREKFRGVFLLSGSVRDIGQVVRFVQSVETLVNNGCLSRLWCFLCIFLFERCF